MSAKKSTGSTPQETPRAKKTPTSRAKRPAASPKSVPKQKEQPPEEEDDSQRIWHFRLFVAGQSPKSLLAYSNLKQICERHLTDRYTIELVDLVKEPALAREHQIVAVPTLIRQLPEPMKRLIGDLSNHQRTLLGMDLQVS